MVHTFISYATQDQSIADRICTAMEASGIRCWYAPRDIKFGFDYARSIVEAIEVSSAFLLVFSSQSNKSTHVRSELDHAKTHKIPILTVKIEDVEPSREMSYFTSSTQWFNAIGSLTNERLHELSQSVKRLIPLHAVDVPCNPYQMLCGRQLSLPELPDVVTTALKFNNCFLVAFGSGRFPESSGRVGLVSDCLYLPEIITSVQKLAHAANVEPLEWCSALDIDLIADLESGPAGYLSHAHLLLPGTGDINGVTGRVFEYYEKRGRSLRPGCSPAFTPNIIGTRGIHMPYSGEGFLSVCVNPWNLNALCIIAAGTHAAGTTGALYLLREYLEGRADFLGNNRFNSAIPAKIFTVRQIHYQFGVRDKEELSPAEDIRNTDNDLATWRFSE